MKLWNLKNLCIIFLGAFLVISAMDQRAEALFGIGENAKAPRMIVVMVDMSGSTNAARRTVYRNAFDKIYQSFREGDRIVVGTITGTSFIDFKPVVDAEIPKKSVWVNRISFEQNTTKTKNTIKEKVEGLLSRKKGTPRTEILNSLNIADTLFHNEKRNKILVILSDMVQDSKEYNFARVQVTDTYIENIIKYRKRNKLVPNLKGVKVYVAGASAEEARKFRSIEKFWNRYFKVTGADFSTHRYGHSLLEFEKDA